MELFFQSLSSPWLEESFFGVGISVPRSQFKAPKCLVLWMKNKECKEDSCLFISFERVLIAKAEYVPGNKYFFLILEKIMRVPKYILGHPHVPDTFDSPIQNSALERFRIWQRNPTPMTQSFPRCDHRHNRLTAFHEKLFDLVQAVIPGPDRIAEPGIIVFHVRIPGLCP